MIKKISIGKWALCVFICIIFFNVFTVNGQMPTVVRAENKTYYMATDGSDSHNGESADRAFASINKFNEVARPGDTLLIRGGTYYGQSVTLTCHGTWDNKITIKNYQNEVPVFDGLSDRTDGGYAPACFIYSTNDGKYLNDETRPGHFVIDGLIIKNYARSGINMGSYYDPQSGVGNEFIDGANLVDVTVRNVTVDSCGQNGITFMVSSDVTVENCLVSRVGFNIDYDSWSSAINFYQMRGDNNIVKNCIAFHAVDVSYHHSDGNGFILDRTWDKGSAVVQNCLFFENGGVGIALTASDRAFVINNTMADNNREPTYFHDGKGLAVWEVTGECEIRNNIIYQGVLENIADTQYSGDVSTASTASSSALYVDRPFEKFFYGNNLISGTPGSFDPSFADPNGANYWLAPWSAAIDMAEDAPAETLWYDPAIIKRESATVFMKNSTMKYVTTEPYKSYENMQFVRDSYPNPDEFLNWFRFAPDIDFIVAQGGLSRCMGVDLRSNKSSTPDMGALESDSAKTVYPSQEYYERNSNLFYDGSFEFGSHAGYQSVMAAGTDGYYYRYLTAYERSETPKSAQIIVKYDTNFIPQGYYIVNNFGYSDYDIQQYVTANRYGQKLDGSAPATFVGIGNQATTAGFNGYAGHIAPDGTRMMTFAANAGAVLKARVHMYANYKLSLQTMISSVNSWETPNFVIEVRDANGVLASKTIHKYSDWETQELYFSTTNQRDLVIVVKNFSNSWNNAVDNLRLWYV